MNIPKIYLAGPLGFSEAGQHFHNEVMIPAIRAQGFEVLDPWTLTPTSVTDRPQKMPYGVEQRGAWRGANRIIANNNAVAIQNADFMLAVLDGTDVDSGTAAEIGFAYGLGMRILGYRGDFRLSADNPGSTVNLQVEYFITSRRGQIVTQFTDALEVLGRWRKTFDRNSRRQSSRPRRPKYSGGACD